MRKRERGQVKTRVRRKGSEKNKSLEWRRIRRIRERNRGELKGSGE